MSSLKAPPFCGGTIDTEGKEGTTKRHQGQAEHVSVGGTSSNTPATSEAPGEFAAGEEGGARSGQRARGWGGA